MNLNDIAKGNNRGKLTNAQVGVQDGWRLLHKDEILARRKVYDKLIKDGRAGSLMHSTHIQILDGNNPTVWSAGGKSGVNSVMSYRTKLSPNRLAEFIRPEYYETR